MANRVTTVTYATPTIKQITVNGTNYWVKDADARTYITNIETAVNNLGTAADKDFTPAMGTHDSSTFDDALPTSRAVKDYVDLALAGIHTFKYQVASQLPEASAETEYIIYLIPESGTQSGTYTEYLTIADPETPNSYRWEKIGTTATDLSEYAKWGTYTGTAAVIYDKASANTDAFDLGTKSISASFAGTTATISMSVNDYATGITTTAAGTATVNDVSAAAFTTAPTVEVPTFASLVINWDGEGRQDLVTGLTYTAASTSAITYATDVAFTTAPGFSGTAATISVSGSIADHYHTVSQQTSSFTYVSAHTPAAWSATVSNEILSFNWTADTSTTSSRTFVTEVGDNVTQGAGYTSLDGATTVTSTGTYTPAGSITNTGLTVSKSTATFAKEGIKSITASYDETIFAPTLKGTTTVNVANTSITLTKSTKTFVTSAIGTATLTKGNKTFSSEYTPAGDVTGSVTLGSHSHTIGSATATASGTATVTLSA